MIGKTLTLAWSEQSVCAQCGNVIEWEHTPWNHQWRRLQPPYRCVTMIGCIPAPERAQ